MKSVEDVRKQMQATAQEYAVAAQERQKLEADLKRAKRREAYLGETVLPELMAELGSEVVRLEDGSVISLKDQVLASIPKDKATDAFNWLDSHGHGGLIKRKVLVSFDRDQEAQAEDLLKQLQAEYPMAAAERTVHPSTLRAWAKGMIEAGDVIPPEITVEKRRVAQLKVKE